jgi:DnaD/phage-associated family protein
MKDSFILYTEQKEVVDKLTDEQAGKLFKAIYEYAETEQMPQLDSLLDIVIIPFKQSMDRNTEKWEEIKKKRSEAGRMGAEIKKQKQAKEANAKFVKQSTANQAVNVNVPVNVNVNDNVTTTVVNNTSDSCVDGLQKIIDFYQENIGLITPYGVELFTTYANEMPCEVIVFAMQKAVEANKKTIQYIKAILNNWQKAGIKTLADAKRENKVKNKMQDQRGYDNLDFLYKNMEG